MKVVLFNGSRREKGCTYTALNIVASELNAAGIETEIFFVGGRVLKGETDAVVHELKGETEAVVHEAKEILKSADAVVYGSPVYYASPSGEMLMFLDRLYGLAEAELLFKPAATLASARRAGTSATLDALNKYPTYAQQPLVTSRYWNMVHGSSPEDVLKDEEGVQIMRELGRNMAWLLKSIEAGKQAGIAQPVAEKKIYTNFIR